MPKNIETELQRTGAAYQRDPKGGRAEFTDAARAAVSAGYPLDAIEHLSGVSIAEVRRLLG
jgi:hypothetical protein